MARDKLNAIKSDVSSDSGAVLWSIVKGEALEYPITLDFLDVSTSLTSYTFEAVVIEADNVVDQQEKPSSVKPGGVQLVLTVRKPDYIGVWSPTTPYSYENVVYYNDTYYKLRSGLSRTSAVTPNVDPLWEETGLNVIYLQFPATMGGTWTVQPSVISNSYGFFELRVTEPSNPVFQRTWKPVRGMVELLFSPTDVVP